MNAQFDLFAGKKARDVGMATAVEHAGQAFRRGVVEVVGLMQNGARVTGEDIRQACVKAGVVPRHPNSWGGTIMGLVRSGYLRDTGEMAHMKDVRSHARRTPVYEVVRHDG